MSLWPTCHILKRDKNFQISHKKKKELLTLWTTYSLVFDILNQFERKKLRFLFLVRFFVGIFYLALVPTFEVFTLPMMKFSSFNFT